MCVCVCVCVCINFFFILINGIPPGGGELGYNIMVIIKDENLNGDILEKKHTWYAWLKNCTQGINYSIDFHLKVWLHTSNWFAGSGFQDRLEPASEPTSCWKLLSCMFFFCMKYFGNYSFDRYKMLGAFLIYVNSYIHIPAFSLLFQSLYIHAPFRIHTTFFSLPFLGQKIYHFDISGVLS